MKQQALHDGADLPSAQVEQHARETVKWLNGRFLLRPGELYYPHQPVYGFTPYYVPHFRLEYGLLRRVRELSFGSFIDIGAAEGYVPNLMNQLYGSNFPAYNLDISASVIRTARQFYGLERGIVANIENLPLPDKSIDLVFCNDVIEHVPNPRKAIAEMARVAAKYLVVATDEISLDGDVQSFRPALDEPHGHLHRFTRQDMYDLMGPDCHVETFRSTLLTDEIHNGDELYGVKRMAPSFLRQLQKVLRGVLGGRTDASSTLLGYLFIQMLLSAGLYWARNKERWLRYRVANDLLIDQHLVTRFPNRAWSLLAVKDCGGGQLPAADTSLPMDWELLEAMWSRGSIDKRVFGYSAGGFIYLRPEAP